MNSSDLLGSLRAGRVLDVATGKGQFVESLIEELGSYTEIIGMDNSDAGASAFAEAFASLPSVRFVVGDAMAMPFVNESFDTVVIAGSLHHLSDPQVALAEMRRVLRPRGALIVYEQLRDRPTKAELTHVRFHHWNEEILGAAPRPTYRRDELIDLVTTLGLAELQMVEDRDRSDPRDPSKVARYDEFIEERLEAVRDKPDLVARGRTIRERLYEVGINVARALFILGVKL